MARIGSDDCRSAVAVALSAFLFFNLRATVKEIGQSEPHEQYRAGAEWMRNNVPPGQMVFNTDWDDFPRLFYFDSSHYYVSGLDPSYLYDKDPDLSRLYERITLGREDDPGPLIRIDLARATCFQTTSSRLF